MQPNSLDKASYRAQFPHIQEGVTHLNHAGVSPVAQRVVNKVTDLLAGFSRDPAGLLSIVWSAIGECRARLALLMGVPVEHLAFTKNTAHGISIVADNLDWREGDEVIFADCEYPSNTYPWFAQKDRGVSVKIVPTQPDGTVLLEDYEKAFSARTRLVAVSWVQFTTGFRSDLPALIELAHRRGVLVLVDVIQGLGALPLDLTELGADFAAVGSQKWLMGLTGVGGLYVKPDALEHLRLGNMGAGSVKDVMAFSPLGFDPKPTAQRYEEGTPNVPGLVALEATLSLLQEIDAVVIEQEILSVTRHAMEGLKERGYVLLSPEEDAKRAGIVMFRHPTLPNEPIMKALADARINVVTRGGRVRFAPHFYNTNEDIDHALSVLPTG